MVKVFCWVIIDAHGRKPGERKGLDIFVVLVVNDEY